MTGVGTRKSALASGN